MASVDKVQISSTTYDVSPSPSGTLTTGTSGFASNDVADASATSYVSVNKIEATETNSSIFGKITSMVRNIRYLYNKLGTTTMPEDTVTGSISSLNSALSGKAAASHSHTVADLPVSSSQVNSDQYIPTSSLIYSMNETLTSLNDAISGLAGMKGVKCVTYTLTFTSQTINVLKTDYKGTTTLDTYTNVKGVYSSGLPSDCSIDNIIYLHNRSDTAYVGSSSSQISGFSHIGYICSLANSDKTLYRSIINMSAVSAGSGTASIAGENGSYDYTIFYTT